jgi:hypothetical protein
MNALEAIQTERERQKAIGMSKFDETNTVNDYVAYITAYAGRASEKVLRNEKEGVNSRDMLVKAGALCVAAIESLDRKVQ